MRTSFGSPRRQVLVAVISTRSLLDGRTRSSPFTLRTRIHCPAGTRSLSVKALLSVWRSCARSAGGASSSAPRTRVRRCGIASLLEGAARLAATRGGRKGDLAAERAGDDAGGALPEGEVQALGLVRADAVLAGAERDGEVAVDGAVEGGDAELRPHVRQIGRAHV